MENKYFENKINQLKEQFEEKWKAHDLSANERMEIYKSCFKDLKTNDIKLEKMLEVITTKLLSLPCDLESLKLKQVKNELYEIKNNHLKHLTWKIDALLFTVLGGVFIGIVMLVFKFAASGV